MSMVCIGDADDEHSIACYAGRYVCQSESCDFDTLNRWVAEDHYEQHHGEIDGGDKPEGLF